MHPHCELFIVQNILLIGCSGQLKLWSLKFHLLFGTSPRISNIHFQLRHEYKYSFLINVVKHRLSVYLWNVGWICANWKVQLIIYLRIKGAIAAASNSCTQLRLPSRGCNSESIIWKMWHHDFSGAVLSSGRFAVLKRSRLKTLQPDQTIAPKNIQHFWLLGHDILHARTHSWTTDTFNCACYIWL
jgi:hypothetical protein